MGLLILSRRTDEQVVLDFSHCTDADLMALRSHPIKVMPTRFAHGAVKLGFDAPARVIVDRLEIWQDKQKAVATAKAE